MHWTIRNFIPLALRQTGGTKYAAVVTVFAVVWNLLGIAPVHAACIPAPTPISGPVGTISNFQPVFSWTAVPGANFGYTLYILLDDGTWVVRETGIQGTSFRPGSALPADHSMRWKVKGEGDCGAGAYAMSSANFQIVTPPPPECPPEHTTPPTPIGPGILDDPSCIADPTTCVGEPITNTMPTFSWSAVPNVPEYVIALVYVESEFCVFPDPNNVNNCEHGGIDGTSFSYDQPLPIGIPMRWKIKWECPEGSEVYGAQSGSMYFTIVEPPPPPPPPLKRLPNPALQRP